jgi:ferric-dicitrate binding protein FerR (iron transport regulator)
MNDPLDAAIIAYLAGDIDETDFAWLEKQLKENPAAAQRFAQICEHDIVLSSVLRIKSARSPARHTRLKRLAKKRSFAHGYYAAAAAMVLAVTTWLLFRKGAPEFDPSSTPIIATVKTVEGDATLQQLANRSQTRVALGTGLHQGDSLHVAGHGSLSFAYADGTIVSMESESDLTLSPATNKRVTLGRGSVSADVAPQPANNPMQFITSQAQADVVGTQLRVSTNDGATRLDVTSGSVRLTRNADHQSMLVNSGFFATATANVASPMTQRTIKSLRDELPANARIMFQVAFADHPAQWEGDFATPPGNPDGAIAMGSHLFQPKTRFYGEIRSPLLEKGISPGASTYLRFRYRVDGFKSGDLIKLMLKKKDGSIFHGFVRPEYEIWSVATLRLDGKFRDLEHAARSLSADDTLFEIVFLGATPDGQQAQQGPRLWIDEAVIFASPENLPVLNVEQ